MSARPHDPCQRHGVYLRVDGRRFGVETETRRWPRYIEIRLILPSSVRIWTHRASALESP